MNDVPDDRAKYLLGQPKDLSVSQKFRLILKLLRADFPAVAPIKVRRLTGEIIKRKIFGWCSLVNSDGPKAKKYFLITINKSCSWSQQFDTILHEWAHALTWNEVEQGKDHSDVFARAYGKLYRAYIED